MKESDINNYIPSLLNPRSVRKCDFNLTQTNTTKLSLRLKSKKVQQHVNKQRNNCKNDKENINPQTIMINNTDTNLNKSNILCNSTIINGIQIEFNSSIEILDGSEISENEPACVDKVNHKKHGKRCAITDKRDVKKKKNCFTDKAKEAVPYLNSNVNNKSSHVIFQSPNYTSVEFQNLYHNKFKDNVHAIPKSCNHNTNVNSLEVYYQKVSNPIKKDSYFNKGCSIEVYVDYSTIKLLENSPECDKEDMSKTSGVSDALKRDRPYSSPKKVTELSPKSTKTSYSKKDVSLCKHDIKSSTSDAQRGIALKTRHDIPLSAPSHRKKPDSTHFSVGQIKDASSGSPTRIPYYKIVAGTHFAVDAFAYGDIRNVKHYFLTHFHSDHYAGLKKTFNKTLFCSKITADLCVSRLGVNPKYIQIIRIDETIRIEGVEVTAVDANHCPGAIMLVFTLLNGKTILHTGDFRANPSMESYPVFWNKDIYTIYLDTTYCNPRYDFPTQDQSLEMALYLLRQKKMVMEKAGKKFTTVLIVCGTYTIGKEKFFLGMARRVGCTVWASPEKDRVLQTVEGRSFSHAPAQSCQLHVVPVRDLTHEKLRNYLDSFQGTFTEVVAFKPSGWENGKNSTVEKDLVTIHGIPYSEHSSFSELIRFVKFLKPKQLVPTVDIAGGIKAVQKYFPCPFVFKEDASQTRLTDYFNIKSQQQVTAVT